MHSKAGRERKIYPNGMNSHINGYKSHEMRLPCFPRLSKFLFRVFRVHLIKLYTYTKKEYQCQFESIYLQTRVAIR